MAYFPQSATVSIGAADAAVGSCTNLSAYVTNFNQSGGDIETEAIKVFGGGNIQKEGEKNEVEISFDFVARDSGPTFWDQLIAGSTLDGSSAVDYADDPTDKVIYLEVLGDDGSTYMTRAYNNVKPTQIETSMEADGGYMQGTITFKLAPTQADGTGNVQVVAAESSTVSW